MYIGWGRNIGEGNEWLKEEAGKKGKAQDQPRCLSLI